MTWSASDSSQGERGRKGRKKKKGGEKEGERQGRNDQAVLMVVVKGVTLSSCAWARRCALFCFLYTCFKKKILQGGENLGSVEVKVFFE